MSGITTGHPLSDDMANATAAGAKFVFGSFIFMALAMPVLLWWMPQLRLLAPPKRTKK
jgi:hypothetical protein